MAGGRPGGRANTRFMHVVKGDMKLVGAREEDAVEAIKRRQLIGCGHHCREQPPGEDGVLCFVQNVAEALV